jgi:hypothetical protein
MIQSYPSIYNLGHKAVAEIFAEPVVVQEKVDGSQVSFGVYPEGGCTVAEAREMEVAGTLVPYAGRLRVRSKGAELVIEAPDKMFAKAVDVIKAVAHLLTPGWTYRGEYLAKPKHNALAYDRVPKNHIVLFDVDRGDQDYVSRSRLLDEACSLHMEVVPQFTEFEAVPGRVAAEDIRGLLQQTSFLGGQKVEGVVIKNYGRLDPHTKKVLMAKFVSEAFKEVHGAEWKMSNPTRTEIVERVIAKFRTPARWAKAVQHLREDGKLEDSPRDIALLFKEVPADVLRECEQEIKQELFDLAWPKVHRGVTAGLAEWYKERLLERQFEDLQEQALRTTADEPPSESAYRTMGSGNCGMDR